MPTLKSSYRTREEIPAGYEALYVEAVHGRLPDGRGGYVGFHLTGIEELDHLRTELHELKQQVATDEHATRARIQAAVDRVTREVRAPGLWRSALYTIEAIRRAFSRIPLGDDYRNPWSREGWNITQQGEYFRKHGMANARTAAKSVGSYIGATRPPPVAA